MKNLRTTLVLAALAFPSAAALAESAVVLKQTNAPLAITSYTTTFRAETSSSRYVTGHPDQILHSVTYKNASPKRIVALQIGLASFDAFNGFMGRFSGWGMDNIPAGEVNSGQWTQNPYATFSFRNFGTGVAYVNAVRFEDGTIWRANLKEVLLEMQKFEKDLKAEDLAEKKEK
jgi:hypothetical protein